MAQGYLASLQSKSCGKNENQEKLISLHRETVVKVVVWIPETFFQVYSSLPGIHHHPFYTWACQSSTLHMLCVFVFVSSRRHKSSIALSWALTLCKFSHDLCRSRLSPEGLVNVMVMMRLMRKHHIPFALYETFVRTCPDPTAKDKLAFPSALPGLADCFWNHQWLQTDLNSSSSSHSPHGYWSEGWARAAVSASGFESDPTSVLQHSSLNIRVGVQLWTVTCFLPKHWKLWLSPNRNQFPTTSLAFPMPIPVWCGFL